MTIKKMNHMGVIVKDLSATKTFFLDIGLELKGEWEVEEEWMYHFVGQHNVKATCAGFGAPDDQTWIELIKFHYPEEDSVQQMSLAIQHIAFSVNDIEGIVASLKEKGTGVISAIQHYNDSCKLCYVRGPEGIIVELAEEIN
ncbi:VOC family protein [Fictibacillus aquaticus]|uniref:Glyoxalase n=1 Tax=Fictibacillus aquaticus TaxID=2021314 RepID=A0A235F6B6_9BACL|nr:VOC family protein [Fictibacillus aquaticus]OYD56738.1 glyoxalase [Fictibacillus aquaticus]